MLELKGVEKKYGSVHAVRSTDLTIRDGEFFSLLGPSGCGKTTLLRMLGGFESPSSGQIVHNGKRIDNLPANQRQFNMVFQRYALFPHLNVWENIAFGLRMKKVADAELKVRVAEALALVKMETYGLRGISTLSGGQQQRIAVARALVNRPQVLLLDEPLSALDLKLRQQMQVELLSLQRRLKHTFLFVTHDQEEALTLSDRIAVMNGGVVEQVGTAQEIYEIRARRSSRSSSARLIRSKGRCVTPVPTRSWFRARPNACSWCVPQGTDSVPCRSRCRGLRSKSWCVRRSLSFSSPRPVPIKTRSKARSRKFSTKAR